MDQDELLRFFAASCDRLGLSYFITGSVATIYFGEPRFTNDLDAVVALDAAGVSAFCAQFPAPPFYLSREAADRAVRARGQFNIVHPASGLKVDVIVPKLDDLDRSRFARARRLPVGGGADALFATPEDVILKKMETYGEGGSEKHLRDIAGVLRVSGDRIDRAYIADWAARRGLTDLWTTILARLHTAFSS